MPFRSGAKPYSPFRCFNSSAEVIRLVVLMYVRFPLLVRNVEELLFDQPDQDRLLDDAEGHLPTPNLASVD